MGQDVGGRPQRECAHFRAPDRQGRRTHTLQLPGTSREERRLMTISFSSQRRPAMHMSLGAAILVLSLALAPVGCKRHRRVTIRTVEEGPELVSVVATADPHVAATTLTSAPFHISPLLFAQPENNSDRNPAFPFSDVRLTPHYPAKSPLADVLSLVAPGSDEYITEKYAVEVETVLKKWSENLKASIRGISSLAKSLHPMIEASPLIPTGETPLRSGYGVDVVRRQFAAQPVPGRERFLQSLEGWLGQLARVETAEFEIYGIEEIAATPLTVRLEIRYDIVATRKDQSREERVGSWRTEWSRDETAAWIAHRWEAGEEMLSVARGPVFIDVTHQALGATESYNKQMMRSVDYWRPILAGAVGVDVYANNGVAVGDFDNDGFDDFYVCQPAGLPNRLYRNRGDGTFEDVTEKAGVGVLDNTACALFADFRNLGLQDLLVVCGTGPMLFLNQGDGTFSVKPEAFKFA